MKYLLTMLSFCMLFIVGAILPSCTDTKTNGISYDHQQKPTFNDSTIIVDTTTFQGHEYFVFSRPARYESLSIVHNPDCPIEKQNHNMRDYQMEVGNSGTTIYDGDRKITFIPFDMNRQLDSIIVDDNQ